MKKVLCTSLALSIGLAGCGGSAPDDKVAQARPAPDAYGFSGHAVDGLIANGDVLVFDFTDGSRGNVLGTGKTDSLGVFDTSISGVEEDGQFVQACVRSGSYTEEASGATITLEDGQELCAVKFFDPSANFSVVINPLSHYATGYAEYLVEDKKEAVPNAVEKANTAFSSLAGYDILNTVPRDATDPLQAGKSYDDQMQAAYAIAGWSQMTLDIAENQGLTRHSNDFSSIALHQAMYNDIRSDGVLDGKGIAQNGITEVTLGMGTTQFGRNTQTLDLAKSTIDFVGSDNNKAGITIAEMLNEQERLASSTSTLLEPLGSGDALPTLDGEAPVITFDLVEGQFISGELVVSGQIEDFSGVKSVVVTIDGVDYPQESGDSFSHSIMTTGDGPLSITVTAVDLLNNSGSANIGVQLANSIPVPTQTSAALGNNTNYQFTATLTNYDQGINTITVNGVSASIDASSVITADLTLTQGVNPIEMVILDGVGVTHTYNFTTSVDTTLPTAVFDRPNLATGYEVYYKNFSIEEPYLGDLKYDKTGHPFYIDQFHVSLNGQSISEANLDSQHWAYIKFTPTDPATEANDFVATPAGELSVSYQYVQGSAAQPSRELVAFDAVNNIYIIPLASEFLIDDWEQYEGVQKIIINIEDNAGMVTSQTIEFLTYDSVPSLDSNIDADTWVSANNNTLSFDSTDFTGIDTVEFVVNGVTYTSGSVTNPEFLIDTTSLPSGLNLGRVKAYKDGLLVVDHEVQLSVDNTTASINVTSPEYHNTSEYVVNGTVIDSESGIDFVLVDGISALYTLISDTFSKAIGGLVEGEYSTTVAVTNGSGLESSVNKTFFIDLTAPLVADQYPSPANPYQVSYQNNLSSAPSESELQFLNDTSIFSLNPETVKLKGNLPTVSYLKSNKIPFVMFDVTDSFSNGAGTSNNELAVVLTYSQNGSPVFSERSLSSATNEYILPITEEFLDEGFFNVTPDVIHELKLDISDKAGNTVTQFKYFKLTYMPSIAEQSALTSKNNYSSVSSVSAQSNSDGEFFTMTLSNPNDLPVTVNLTAPNTAFNYTHVWNFGKLWLDYTRTVEREFTVWYQHQKIGEHPTHGSNVELSDCRQGTFDNLAYSEFNSVNNEPLTLTETNSFDGYANSVPVNGSAADPVSLSTNHLGNPVHSFTFRGAAYDMVRNFYTQSSLGWVFSYTSRTHLCINKSKWETHGILEAEGPHQGATINSVLGIYTVQAPLAPNPSDTISVVKNTSYAHHGASPFEDVTTTTDNSTYTSVANVSVVRSDSSEVNFNTENEIALAPNESVDINISYRNPNWPTKGSSCAYDANGEDCDQSYTWSINTALEIDTYLFSSEKNNYRTKQSVPLINTGSISR